jgi:hypothetical protein
MRSWRCCVNAALIEVRFSLGCRRCAGRAQRSFDGKQIMRSNNARRFKRNRKLAGGRWIRTPVPRETGYGFGGFGPFSGVFGSPVGRDTERDAPSCDQELKVRIHLPPAESLQTFCSRSRRPADYRTRYAGYGVKRLAHWTELVHKPSSTEVDTFPISFLEVVLYSG